MRTKKNIKRRNFIIFSVLVLVGIAIGYRIVTFNVIKSVNLFGKQTFSRNVESKEVYPDIPGYLQGLIDSGVPIDDAIKNYCEKRYHYPDPSCIMETTQREKFTYYDLDYALDDTTVYIGRKSGTYIIYQPFEWLDRATFEYLGKGYFKDKNGFYFDNGLNYEPYTTITITNVDPLTAELVHKNGTYFIKDRNHVYLNILYSAEDVGVKIGEVQTIKLKIYPEADATTLQASTEEGKYLEDKNNYYEDRFGLEEYIIITPKSK